MPAATRRVGRDNFVGFYADDPGLITQFDAVARRNDRSRSAEMRLALRHYLRREASGIRLAQALAAADKKASQ
jgi:predicted transcriptional regulator